MKNFKDLSAAPAETLRTLPGELFEPLVPSTALDEPEAVIVGTSLREREDDQAQQKKDRPQVAETRHRPPQPIPPPVLAGSVSTSARDVNTESGVGMEPKANAAPRACTKSQACAATEASSAPKISTAQQICSQSQASSSRFGQASCSVTGVSTVLEESGVSGFSMVSGLSGLSGEDGAEEVTSPGSPSTSSHVPFVQPICGASSVASALVCQTGTGLASCGGLGDSGEQAGPSDLEARDGAPQGTSLNSPQVATGQASTGASSAQAALARQSIEEDDANEDKEGGHEDRTPQVIKAAGSRQVRLRPSLSEIMSFRRGTAEYITSFTDQMWPPKRAGEDEEKDSDDMESVAGSSHLSATSSATTGVAAPIILDSE